MKKTMMMLALLFAVATGMKAQDVVPQNTVMVDTCYGVDCQLNYSSEEWKPFEELMAKKSLVSYQEGNDEVTGLVLYNVKVALWEYNNRPDEADDMKSFMDILRVMMASDKNTYKRVHLPKGQGGPFKMSIHGEDYVMRENAGTSFLLRTVKHATDPNLKVTYAMNVQDKPLGTLSCKLYRICEPIMGGLSVMGEEPESKLSGEMRPIVAPELSVKQAQIREYRVLLQELAAQMGTLERGKRLTFSKRERKAYQKQINQLQKQVLQVNDNIRQLISEMSK